MRLGDSEKFNDCLIDTLVVNSMSTFLLQRSPKERRFSRWMEILSGEHPASLLDEDMVITDIGELGKCIQATDQQQRERLQHMCRKLKQCKQLLNRVTYLHGQRTSIQKIPEVRAVTVHTLSAPLGLSPEQANFQRDLREQSAVIRRKLAQLEEGITVLRAKVTNKISPDAITIGTSVAGQSMKKPAMSAVTSTITKMTKIAESKGSDIAVLEAQMRKLGLDVSAARGSREALEQTTGESASLHHSRVSGARGSREALEQSTGESANLRPRVRDLQVTREACDRWKDKARRKEKLELVRKAFEAKKPVVGWND
jgi:nucleoporin NUP159